MVMLRDLGPLERYPYLAGLGLDPDDAGRLDVVTGAVEDEGLYVEAATGDSRLLTGGDLAPEGVWIAQREIDTLKPGRAAAMTENLTHGFGEGWGDQDRQLGGDRSYPEEDAGGTRRVPHTEPDENTDPYVNSPQPA